MKQRVSEEMISGIEWALSQKIPCIYEMILSPEQVTEPKVSSRKLDNGQMVSAPMEDMAPFLSRDELEANMLVPMMEG